MFFRRVSVWLLAATLPFSVSFAQTAKRPLNHNDYDGWRTIAGQHLSADGKFLAYGVFPQEGDGEVVIRNLVSGKDTHLPAGARPQPAGATTEEGPAPEARATTIAFSSDSKYVVFSTFPAKADTEKAKKEKKTADQMPKDGMTIIELATGKVTNIERVRRFSLPEKAAGYLAYQREAAVQAVVDRGVVDENAIGIQGHSWGGYQIAYMVTKTHRFRAVEAGAPVADMISAYDGIRWGTGITRQVQYDHGQSRIGGSIWQYPTRFIENSPIFWADRVETPVMILQNDGDTAVP